MLDGTKDKPEDLAIKQVEINTIASSFGGLSPPMRGLHKYVISDSLSPSIYTQVKYLRYYVPLDSI